MPGIMRPASQQYFLWALLYGVAALALMGSVLTPTASAQGNADPGCPGVVFPSSGDDYVAVARAIAECDRAKGNTEAVDLRPEHLQNASRRDALLPWLIGGLIVAIAIPGIAYAVRTARRSA